MSITAGIEPTICGPKVARLPTAIIVIFTSAAKIRTIIKLSNITTKKNTFSTTDKNYGEVLYPNFPAMRRAVAHANLLTRLMQRYKQ